MKKLILAALLAVSLNGFAQEADKKGVTDKTLQKMTTELSLTTATSSCCSESLEEKLVLTAAIIKSTAIMVAKTIPKIDPKNAPKNCLIIIF